MAQGKLPLTQLRAFHAVARRGGVTRAAEDLRVSQPAVSQAIAALESAFGVELLDRSAFGPFLTAQGLILKRRCAAFFDALDDIFAPGGAEAAARVNAGHIRAVVAIAEHGSLALAAEALGLSRPALQRAAREIERIVAEPLYLRSPSGLAPTPALLTLAGKLREAVREIDAAQREIDASPAEAAICIAVGTLPLSSAALIAGACGDLLREFPEARFKIQEGRFMALLADLRLGEIDLIFGVLRDPDGADVEQTPIAPRRYHVAARRGHPLAGPQKIALADLQRYDWVLPGPGNARRRACDDLLASFGAQPRVRVETNSVTTQREILMSTDYLTLLTTRELEASRGALAPVPWEEPPALLPEGLTTRAGWRPSLAQSRFVALLKRRARGGRLNQADAAN